MDGLLTGGIVEAGAASETEETVVQAPGGRVRVRAKGGRVRVRAKAR